MERIMFEETRRQSRPSPRRNNVANVQQNNTSSLAGRLTLAEVLSSQKKGLKITKCHQMVILERG